MAQKRDYIIPEDYIGRIAVVESECGLTPEKKDGRLQFVIPSNGVYLFDGELKSGILDEKYYVRKQSGERVEIKAIYRDTEIDTSGEKRIVGVSGGSFSNRTSYNKEGEVSIRLRSLHKNIVLNKPYRDKELWQLSEAQVKIIDSLLVSCKSSKED